MVDYLASIRFNIRKESKSKRLGLDPETLDYDFVFSPYLNKLREINFQEIFLCCESSELKSVLDHFIKQVNECFEDEKCDVEDSYDFIGLIEIALRNMILAKINDNEWKWNDKEIEQVFIAKKHALTMMKKRREKKEKDHDLDKLEFFRLKFREQHNELCKLFYSRKLDNDSK